MYSLVLFKSSLGQSPRCRGCGHRQAGEANSDSGRSAWCVTGCLGRWIVVAEIQDLVIIRLKLVMSASSSAGREFSVLVRDSK